MPNFECYGISADKIGGIESVVSICSTKQLLWENDWVITHIQSQVFDKERNEKPFVRIVSTKEITVEQLKEVIKHLKTLGYDIEIMFIDHFFPQKE